ncbi:MAG: hypothetical protein H6767_03715 [Candidatus Peribacteria bacterium]|nr:MAG: hypothetical protein H6767_03715 [Candidatus Peribacteria bacterium]
MSYSVSATQESYEIGTVLENNGAGTPSGFIIPQTYAAEYKSSYLNGNYNGKYYRTFSGGTTLIYALPSLTMNDTGTGDVSLYVNQATDKFSINGYGTIPESFSGITTEQTKINYIPRLLFSGNKCGVETDQEIVNFIALTRDAYNKEPFTYLRSYADVFDDYEYLKDNLIDFEKLKVLGVKINESLQCNINNFKTTDIFPTACGTENGIFDLMEDGFDIANSCIYTQS